MCLRVLKLRNTRRRAAPRRGVAAVEFAIVAPVFVALVLGIIEFGRAMMIGELLDNAARAGCRAGTLSGNSNTAVTTAITNCLPGVSGTTPTIQVNGVTKDVSTATTGDTISVQITAPYSSNSWLPTSKWLKTVTLTGKAVMPHE
jgi:Flp pilus assembly protein TadG